MSKMIGVGRDPMPAKRAAKGHVPLQAWALDQALEVLRE
jgi:hypothetical protein